MAILRGIFCLNVMLLTSSAILVNGENFAKSSIELTELSNGTTRTIQVKPNQKVTLSCFSQGYDQRILGWFLDSTRLETEDQRKDFASVSSLSLEMPQSERTNRIYTCRTENLENNLWAKVEIIVQEEDLEQFYVEVTETSSSLSWELNVPSTKTAAELNCFLQGVNPSKVGWYFDDIRLPTEDSKDGYAFFSKLKIPTEELSSSRRKYTCRSEELEEIQFATVTVRTKEEDLEQFYVEVTETSSSLSWELNVPSTKTAAELNCFLQGVNPSEVGWYFDDIRLPTEDSKDGYAFFSKLKIPIEELSASGRKYTCRSEELEVIQFATVTVKAEGKSGDGKVDSKNNPCDVVPEQPTLSNTALGAIITIWTVAVLLLIVMICLIVKRLSKNQLKGNTSSPSYVEGGLTITDPRKPHSGPKFAVDSSAPSVHGAKHKSFTSKSNYHTNILQFSVNSSTVKAFKANYKPIQTNV